MSKKKTTAKKAVATKVSTKTAKAPSIAQLAAAAAAAEDAGAKRDDGGNTVRLPPAGTVIKKLDRYGAVRCQCTVLDEGIRYKGHVFGSLSGAAMAAAKDLGLENKTQNGFTFWGLEKPKKKLDDPKGTLQKSADRFQSLAADVLKAASEDARPELRAVLAAHEHVIHGLLGDGAR